MVRIVVPTGPPIVDDWMSNMLCVFPQDFSFWPLNVEPWSFLSLLVISYSEIIFWQLSLFFLKREIALLQHFGIGRWGGRLVTYVLLIVVEMGLYFMFVVKLQFFY